MGRLEGCVAIVTGAAQGIGAAISLALAKEGCMVVASDLVEANSTIAVIESFGGIAESIQADVSRASDVKSLVDETLERFGKLNILVNNAGLFTSLKFRSTDELDGDEWDQVMQVNAKGVFHCVKACIPALRSNGGGSIINISSSTVFSGMPRMLHYVASKGAVTAMTRSLARELGPDLIRVNAIGLGLTLSTRVEQSEEFNGRRALNLAARSLTRDQYVEDCTGMVVHLASSESGFTTGQTIVIDGGAIMH